MPAAFLAQVFAQQLTIARIQQPHVQPIPLHLYASPDPTRRRTVISCFYFHATIQMDHPLTVLIKAEGFEWQWQQVWALFGKHGRHLSFGSAVNARISPVCFPAIEISLCCFQTLEALAFEWCFLRMAHPGFNLTFAIWISHSARHGYHAVVGQHITVERIEGGVVDVRSEHSFTQIVEHDDPHTAAQPAERCFMEFGPDARAGAKGEQAHGLATVAEGHDE